MLEQLDKQKDMLKRVKSRTMQMFDALGMSDSIVTLIDRRSKGDIAIFVFLCILTLAVIYGLLYYVRQE